MDQDWSAAAYRTIGNGQEQDQVLGGHDQAGSDDVAVSGVAACTSACLDLDHDAVTIVESVYFVGHFCMFVTAGKHRSPDALGRLLPELHGESELAEASGELLGGPGHCLAQSCVRRWRCFARLGRWR
jgi:hypothetical protein